MMLHKRPRSESCAIDYMVPKRYRTHIVRRSTTPQPIDSTATTPVTTKSPLPLTRENLNRLQNTIAVSMGRSRTPSPSRTSNNLDTCDKLAAFKVHVDTSHPLPSELEAHLKSLIQRPRNASIEASPNAKTITKRRRLAADQNKWTGINHIEPYMLFRGEADFDERVNPVPYITSKNAVFLSRYFRPRPPNDGVKSTFGELSQPRPDSCIGYVSQQDAQSAAIQAPFSADEEQILQAFPLTQFLHFPFLTSQWKPRIGNENILHARYHAARDGAVVVNYLCQFYKNSDIEPSIVQTCHFSLTCDFETTEIWVHWREGSQYHMELVNKSSLRQLSEVESARNVLRNIVEYSVGKRWDDIKKAIPSFATLWAQGTVPTIPQVEDCTTASVSSIPSS